MLFRSRGDEQLEVDRPELATVVGYERDRGQHLTGSGAGRANTGQRVTEQNLVARQREFDCSDHVVLVPAG